MHRFADGARARAADRDLVLPEGDGDRAAPARAHRQFHCGVVGAAAMDRRKRGTRNGERGTENKDGAGAVSTAGKQREADLGGAVDSARGAARGHGADVLDVPESGKDDARGERGKGFRGDAVKMKPRRHKGHKEMPNEDPEPASFADVLGFLLFGISLCVLRVLVVMRL